MGPVWLGAALFGWCWECFEGFCVKAMGTVGGLAALGCVLSLS